MAVLLLAQGDFAVPATHARFWNTMGVLIGLGLVAEAAALKMPRTTSVTTIVFIPILASLLLVGPAWAMVVAGTTELVAETAIRRKPLIKILHNSASVVVAVAAAGYLFLLAGGQPSLSEFTPRSLPAFAGASLLYLVVANGAAATAVALSTGSELAETWGQLVGKGLAEDVVSSSISVLLAYLYVELQLLGLLLVVVPLFLVRHALQRNLQLEQANRELLELMVKSIEARDPYTSGHSVRVSMYARALARAVGVLTKDIEQIETAALLHDVGKIYEEFAPILRKNGKLTQAERLLMESHPVRSAELVGTITSLRGYVQQCVRAHHESFDGAGYPDGLADQEIPVGARIIAVADTADAMMSDRPYRKALTYGQVLGEVERCAGTQFDPWVVEAFKRSPTVHRMVSERETRGDDSVAASGDFSADEGQSTSPSGRRKALSTRE